MAREFTLMGFSKQVEEVRTSKDLAGDEKVMLSVGGDGTFLEAVTIVRHHPIPIAGINSGRLGFLADISQEDINNAIDLLKSEKTTYMYDYFVLSSLSCWRLWNTCLSIGKSSCTGKRIGPSNVNPLIK